MTLPPGFVNYSQVKGTDWKECRFCANSVEGPHDRRLICWKFGAYVSIYAVCDDFIKKEHYGAETYVKDFEIAQKFRFGLNDLMK